MLLIACFPRVCTHLLEGLILFCSGTNGVSIVQYCRSRGAVVCVGLPAKARISAEVFPTVVRMITIKGSYVGNRLDTQEAIDFFKRGLIKAPFKIAKLSELTKVFIDIYSITLQKRVFGASG